MTEVPLSFNGRSSTLLVVLWVEFGFGTLLMAMRTWTNIFIIRKWRSDYWWALITYLFAVVTNATTTVGAEAGLGAHLEDLMAQYPDAIPQNQFYNWLSSSFRVLAIALGKVAIVAFILQIEGRAMKALRRWSLYFLAASNFLVNALIIPISWTQCVPSRKLWDEGIKGNCNGRRRNQTYGYFQGSFSALVDLLLALYPILIFSQLQVRFQVKIALMVLFGFGVFAAIASAIKTYNLRSITATSDLTYLLADLDIWAVTEMWTIFIVGCIPTNRSLLTKILEVVQASIDRSGYHNQTKTDGTLDARTKAQAPQVYVTSKTSARVTRSLQYKSGSEEQILAGDGIMLTQVVDVQYDRPELESGQIV